VPLHTLGAKRVPFSRSLKPFKLSGAFL